MIFLQVATTLVSLLCIELMLHVSHSINAVRTIIISLLLFLNRGFAAYVAYYVNHPLYTAPSDNQVYAGLAGFLVRFLVLEFQRVAGSLIVQSQKNIFISIHYFLAQFLKRSSVKQ